MSNFKIGDRIRIYGVDKNLHPAKVCATIKDFTEAGLIIVEDADLEKCKLELWDFTLPHPKQCRKIKGLKRIWVDKETYKACYLEFKPHKTKIHDYYEFAEVKK